jgi:hypothetical protein
MPALDRIHNAIRTALIKDGWTITHDPYVIKYSGVTLFADLGAERAIAVERGEEKIVVEIKSFSGASPVQELKLLLGQYDLYRGFLELTAPERVLYLALSDEIYETVFSHPAIQMIVQRFQLPLLVVNVVTEEVVSWPQSRNIAP